MTGEQIPKAAHLVLNCINQMFAIYYWRVSIRPTLPNQVEQTLAYDGIEKACLGDSMVNLRAFCDFVQSTSTRRDDLIADNFPDLCFNTPRDLGASEREKVNKHVAHLTQHDLDEDRHTFHYRDSLDVVIGEAIDFCSYVIENLDDFSNLHNSASDTKTVCERVRDRYVNAPDSGGASD